MATINVLKIKDFRLLLFTRILGIMALQSQAVIVGWQVYSITKSPFMLGLTGLTEAIPAIICALFAGHIVDISRPYKVYIICIAGLVINTFVLFLFAGNILNPPFGSQLSWIFAGIFLSGVLRSFILPSSFSLLSQIVTQKEISSASAWLNSGFQFAGIAGPTLAGLIYGGYGVKIAWLFAFLLMLFAFIMICGISLIPRRYKSQEKRESAVKSIKAGWKFILSNNILLAVMTLDMFAVLFGGAVAMLPAFADQVLNVGSEGLGLLRSAPAIGAIFTAILLALNPFKAIKASLLLWVVVGFGICMIGFGLSTNFLLSIFFLALSGAFDSVSMLIRTTIMQWLTPDHMRGRVSSVNSMFVISSNEIGAFESGVAAKLLGLVPSVVFGGIGTLFVTGITALFSPKLRKMTIYPSNKK